MICISIADIEQIGDALALEADLLELRLDLIRKEPSLLMSLAGENTGIIATCRPGTYPDKERMRMMKEMVDLGARYLDIEVDADEDYRTELMKYARDSGAEIVLSWHDFSETPAVEELKGILQNCYELGADVAKIACMVNKAGDAGNLLSLYELPGRKVILGMGEKGRDTRVQAVLKGAEFTFVASEEKYATAPGQMTYKEFQSLLKKIKAS